MQNKTLVTISRHKKLCINDKSKMSNKVKDISIKNYTYYFLDHIINIKNFDPSSTEI